jgi:hypothetical protein
MGGQKDDVRYGGRRHRPMRIAGATERSDHLRTKGRTVTQRTAYGSA